MRRFVGLDLGAETIKLVVLRQSVERFEVETRSFAEHAKQPERCLRELLSRVDWDRVTGVAATGRACRILEERRVPRIPAKAALHRGVAHAHPGHLPGTVVSIGSHGFSVLELRNADNQLFRENSRCSQGTGNFLRQLVERFNLSIEQASDECAEVERAATLSGRCPVILKTDMTHLANKGEDRRAILAGLYDAVCENVQVLLKPSLSPPRVLLTGGVCRSVRVRENFRRFCDAAGMTLVAGDPEADLYLEALGAALAASDRPQRPTLEDLFAHAREQSFEHVPALRDSLHRVQRMPDVGPVANVGPARVVLGFDMGSTCSKALALAVYPKADPVTVWEGRVDTLGDPVGAAQRLTHGFLEETQAQHEVCAVGATGSGREIVGSLMSSCFSCAPVFVLNEIAAHAEGALHFDPEVDTIFEIGGQDAKYIRLDGGRICDAAMNEACSAGTGSFIAEQGSKFEGIDDVAQMGEIALNADRGISLGQHCSVFMAEVIDEAVGCGAEQGAIIAGIYDSIIQNYLNRVKGNRSIGQRIFCQGTPFRSDALAAAVARQTGSRVIVPPNPSTIGALGIALLTLRELEVFDLQPLDLRLFLSASVDKKASFVCKSTKGCRDGNLCRIDRIHTTVDGKKQTFVWGGNCSLYDEGTRTKKLPDGAPYPFREREALVQQLATEVTARTGRPRVAMTDEFALKGLIPFFATFVRELGFDVELHTHAGPKTLKRGIERASVPYCAPMQIYHGVAAEMLEARPDFVFLPRLRELPRQKDEPNSVTCPIVQASPDILRKSFDDLGRTRVWAPTIDMGIEGLDSERFRASIQRFAQESLGRRWGAWGRQYWQRAFEKAVAAQQRFDGALAEIGERALAFAREHAIVPVVVLGRSYTIHNTVLNSNVPALLSEQGAIAIPAECYGIADDTPVFPDIYWSYGHRNQRAAHQIRRTDDVYALFCSNYSCGPDSFGLHFFSYAMENKPFAIIETDGHSGDAGTKTRIEAFLYCVEEHRRLRQRERAALARTNFKAIEVDKISFADAKRREELIIIPHMGPSTDTIVAMLTSEGFRAEALPSPDRAALRLGRKYTSGKECLPAIFTTGVLLQRLERERDSDERFAFMMPTATGPCRFGVYNLLHKIILERTGWKDRVRIISPSDTDYFAGMSGDFEIRSWVSLMASDLLLMGLQDVRPVEKHPGQARRIYDRYFQELLELTRSAEPGLLIQSLGELPHEMFGTLDLIRRAARELREAKDFSREIPTVSMVGEIYVRLEDAANDYTAERLESRGLRVMMSPFTEWLEYSTFLQKQRVLEGRPLEGDSIASARITRSLQAGSGNRLYDEMARQLGWGPKLTAEDALLAGEPHISSQVYGEACLTVGGPVYEHEHGRIDGVIAVGPHECMPNKLAEAQLSWVGEVDGLLSLALHLNGDPIDDALLDRFAYEVLQRYRAKTAQRVGTAARRLFSMPFTFGAMPFASGPKRPPEHLVKALQGDAAMALLRVTSPRTYEKGRAALRMINPFLSDPEES